MCPAAVATVRSEIKVSFCFAGSVGYEAAVTVAAGQPNRIKSLGDRADPVEFDQHGFGNALFDPFLTAGRAPSDYIIHWSAVLPNDP